jgi:hypothetical protein
MSIGRTFQRAFSALSLNPLVVLGLALIVGALPGLLMSYLFVQFGLTSPGALQAGALSFRAFMGATFFSTVIAMVIGALVQGALTRAVVSANEGRRATFGECLSTGFQVFLPLIGVSILFSIGVGIGFVLLFIPGIILLLMWAVAIPALVTERTGVFGAFSRSAELTKGSRWKILGLFLVLGVIYWLLSIVLGLIGLKMYAPATSPTGLTIANIVGSMILGTIFNVLWGTIQPSLYVELRQAKEGESSESLAQVFA